MGARIGGAAALGVVLLQFLASGFDVQAASPAGLPTLTSLAGDAFTNEERDAILDWVLAQAAVRSRLDGRRHRVLLAASDQAKSARGDVRRAVVYVRNYDSGVVHSIAVDLTTGNIEIRDLPHTSAAPSAEEIEEAMELVRSDPAFEVQSTDPRLTLMGGFQWTGLGPDDRCARALCVQLAFMEPNFDKKTVHFIIVDLSARKIVDRDLVKHRSAETPADRREGN